MKSREVGAGLKERQAGYDILEINEGELCRIILDIHDGPVQNMYAALSQINALQGKLATRDDRTPNYEAINRSLTQIAGLHWAHGSYPYMTDFKWKEK
ncbi:MAG: hypothetical protein ACR2GW_06565 [Pyrinomonadaceae bacterium]|nr:hypothetical protein [Acidobacteriota bacterium]